jgi:GNAT superfamily N-acetyltransferase
MTARVMEAPKPAHAPAHTDPIEIRPALPSDNAALLQLTRLTPMAGRIALRIDRDPDFFALPRARGETTVFVAVSGGKIIGCISAITHIAYINGLPQRVGHCTDLKVHPLFTGHRLALRLVNVAADHARNQGVIFSFNTVADGNHRVMAIAEGRHGTPVQTMLGRFFVDQLLPVPFRHASKHYRVEAAYPTDLPEIAALLDAAYRQKNFAPIITPGDLTPHTKTLIVRHQNRIVATLTLEDTHHLRQNVLIGLPPSLRAALAVLRILTLPIPGLRPPRLGEPLRILYVRWFHCVEGHEPALRALLAEARVRAFRRRYTFLSIALHERDPLRSVVAGLPRLTFISHAMATSLYTSESVTTLLDSLPYEDYALV